EATFQGQIFGFKLPLLGDVLKNNPLSQAIDDIRTNLLQPLANEIRENNLGLDTLVRIIQNQLFSVFDGTLGLLKPFDGTGPVSCDSNIAHDPSTCPDIHFAFLKNNRSQSATIFDAEQAEFDVTLGLTKTYSTGTLALDLGIPALGLDASFTPSITFS